MIDAFWGKFRGVATRGEMASLIKAAHIIRTKLSGRSRPLVQYAYLGDQTAVIATRAGMPLFLDTRDRSLTPHLALMGCWEPDIERALVRLLKRGQRIIEVGANMGYHTLTMGRAVGRTGKIDAFEPNPRLFKLLTDSIFINGYQDIVTTHQSAALDQAGPVKFQFHPRYVGGGNVVVPGYEDSTNLHFDVQGVRLDDVLGAEPPIDLVRMDAEGSEPLVLQGAEELMRRSPRMRIMMEFSAVMMRTRVDVPAFVAWLATFGFKAWRVVPPGSLASVAMADLPAQTHCEIVLSRDVPPGAL